MEQLNRDEVEMEQLVKEEMKDPEKLLCPKAGTATSFPATRTPSPSSLNIVNVMLRMKKNACEESTIIKMAKLLGQPAKKLQHIRPKTPTLREKPD